MILFHSKITAITPEMRQSPISGVGKDAKFEEHQVGWRVRVGLMSFVLQQEERPNFTEGDAVAIIIAKE